MNTNIMNERESDSSISDALAKGALIWAPAYAIAVSTVTHGLTAGSAEPARFTETLMKALMVFSPYCIAAEAIRWMLTSKLPVLKEIGFKKELPPKRPHFFPPVRHTRLREKHA